MINLTHNFQVRALQILNHLAFIFGLIYIFTTGNYYLLLLSLITYWIIGVLGINVYLHRFLSHRSFETYKLIEYPLSIISILTTVGSPLAWTCIHRQHHRSCEKKDDPHSPYLLGNLKTWFGFWNYKNLDVKLIKDLRKDKLQKFLHRNYTKILAIYVLILFFIDPVYPIFIYAIPACLCLHSTSAIIVIAHRHGYRTYDLKQDKSCNSWIANIITLGEGWHNNHHARPYKWSNWERWWEWDIPACIIAVIKKG